MSNIALALDGRPPEDPGCLWMALITAIALGAILGVWLVHLP